MLDGGEGFTVTIQNVLCGSLGVTCSKSVSVSLQGPHAETVNLNSDEGCALIIAVLLMTIE